jgi:outer membrane protein OmpA-like peptidoglycan-associated protein
MRSTLVALCLLSLPLACSRSQDAPPAPAEKAPVARPAPARPAAPAPVEKAPAAPAPAPAAGEDLAAFAAGALVVAEPEPDAVNHASWLLRGPYDTEGFWGVGKGTPQILVVELPARSLIKRVEFDTAMVSGAAKGITVEVSDAGAKAGFAKLVDVELKDRTDNQVFPVAAPVPGRWLRLSVKSSHAPDSVGIGRFRAFGDRLAPAPSPNASGTYATRNGDLHLRQEGTSVVGCYTEHDGTFTGGLEGRVLKLTWREKVEEHAEGAAFMVFSDDTQRFAGLFSYQGEDPNRGRFWVGSKRSGTVGTCPGWIGDVEKQLAKDLESSGRARVYGINFDIDSDRLRDESKPTLDRIVAVLKARPQWSLTLEGHTDSTSTPQHNQDLSERRARAVGKQLETAGIAPGRVKTVGYGATRPVGSNDTALGRAQNRRVELVKQ